MMLLSGRAALLLLGSTTACATAACAGTVVEPGSRDAGESGDACAHATTAADCATCANSGACETCVRALEPAGSTASIVVLIKDCGCAAGSTCNKAGACMGDPTCPSGMVVPTSGCLTCLETMISESDPCYMPLIADCEANAECNQFLTDSQPCFMLP